MGGILFVKLTQINSWRLGKSKTFRDQLQIQLRQTENGFELMGVISADERFECIFA